MIISLKSKLSDDIKSLYEEPYGADVTIQVGEGSASKIFRAHRLILCARSPYFSRELSCDKDAQDASEEKSSFAMIIEQIQPLIFEILLQYVYLNWFICLLVVQKRNPYFSQIYVHGNY